MIIVALTDLHGTLDHIPAAAADLAAADVVLLTGDITHFGHRVDATRVIDAVRGENPHVLAVAGNCDYLDVADYLVEKEMDLHGRHVVVGDMAFIGLGGALPGPGWSPNQYSEDEARRLLSQAVEGLTEDIPWALVSHQPPLNTVADRAGTGGHVGSQAVREFIDRYRPRYCFTGHIHESLGMDTLNHTTIINPGPFRRGGYAWVDTERAIAEIRRGPAGG